MIDPGYEVIDFDLLMAPETRPEVWLAEMRRSCNLRAVLQMLDKCRRISERRCGHKAEAVLYQQMAFRDLARSAKVAEALHRGSFTIPQLVAARSIQKGIVDSIGATAGPAYFADRKAAEYGGDTDYEDHEG